jgi:hypothetical protein
MKGRMASNVLLRENTNSYRQNITNREFWTPENPINTNPRNDLNGAVNPLKSDYFRKTDFIRLQDITFGYTLPKNILSKIHMERVSLFINAKNLITWTSWEGLDPEFIGSQLAAPQTKSFIMGLKLGL